MTSSETGDIKQNWLGRHRRLLMIGVPLMLALAGGVYYLASGRYVSTDDAYIQAAQVSVSANISAQVSEIGVQDNQPVHKGDVLFKLDDKSFAIAEQQAEAQLAAARLQVAAMKASYQQKLADQKAARDNLDYQQREYDRQQKLSKSGIASQAQLDKATQSLQAAQQEVEARQQETATVLANLGGNADIAVGDHPSVQAAQAALDRAKLDLSYTTVYAPIDGIVTKVEQLQPGDYVTKAMPVFTLVSNTDIWVEANFKETDLAHMRDGQNATISVDAYPNRELTGKVASVSPGTGSSFSVLPPENATGNWVKVVQRLPVRISIDNAGKLPLHAGLSATVEVDTERHRSLFGDADAAGSQ
jgi:membrane fusion protein (multidrug efflux system)